MGHYTLPDNCDGPGRTVGVQESGNYRWLKSLFVAKKEQAAKLSSATQSGLSAESFKQGEKEIAQLDQLWLNHINDHSGRSDAGCQAFDVDMFDDSSDEERV